MHLRDTAGHGATLALFVVNSVKLHLTTFTELIYILCPVVGNTNMLAVLILHFYQDICTFEKEMN